MTDIGTEELAHWEIVATMIYKLVKGVPVDQLRAAGLGAHFAEHDQAVYPGDTAGVPWTAAYIRPPPDPITDLHEDMAAEQKARTIYEHLIHLTDDPGIKVTLRF